MPEILVTGGAGFIGSQTVVELFKSGYKPVIIDNFSNSDRSVVARLEKILNSKITLFEGDYRSSPLLKNVFSNHKIEGIIHFAAHKSVGESVAEPLKYYENNVAGLISLLKFIVPKGSLKLVFSSSCTVYGTPDKLPVTEESPINTAESPYGATKQMCESIIKDTSAASKLKSISLRYFNPIGADPSGLIGEMPIGVPANLVPFITQAVAKLRPSLTVYGDDYPTTDGTNVRDYIHVVDLARAHISALEYLSKQRAGSYDMFNIGTGRGSSVLEVIQAFEMATGEKVPYSIGKRRTGDIIASYADVSKAKRLLNWEAQKGLKDALADAWRWQQQLKKGVGH
jgi:UDP-glucose 4-epimerase